VGSLYVDGQYRASDEVSQAGFKAFQALRRFARAILKDGECRQCGSLSALACLPDDSSTTLELLPIVSRIGSPAASACALWVTTDTHARMSTPSLWRLMRVRLVANEET
jgi:hypothetical protein